MASFYLAVYPSATTPTWDRTSGWSGTPTYTHADTDPGSVTSYTWDPDVSGLSAGVEYRLWAIWDDAIQSSNGPISSDAFRTSLAPSLLTNASTIYAPTMLPGSVSVSPSLLTNASTVYAPSVASTTSVSPSLLTNASTIYAPTVSPGSVSVSPSLLTNASTVYSPSVNLEGTQTAQPTLLTNTSAVYGPTMAVGDVTLTPLLLTNTSAIYSVSVTLVSPDDTVIRRELTSHIRRRVSFTSTVHSD